MALALPAGRFQPAEYARVIYQAVPEHGTTIEQMMAPDYWAHVAAKLKPTHRIEVMAEDNSFFAEFIVLDAGRTWAKVDLLRHKVLGDGQAEIGRSGPDGCYVDFRVGPKKWRVMRVSDKTELRSGFETKGDAEAWAKSHAQAMAA